MMAYPFYYLIIYSISDPSKVTPGVMFLPRGINFNAYIDVFNEPKIPRALLISIIRVCTGPLIMLTVTSMAAFTMSKRNLMWHKFISRYIIFTMYISAGLIPYYQLIYSLGLPRTFFVYIIPGMMDVFCFILIRTFIENIPPAMEESAMIDGSGYFNTYLRIIIPMCKPIIATVALFSIVGHWNAYVDTLFYNAADSRLHSLSYVLMQYLMSNSVAFETIQREGVDRVVQPNLQMIRMAITTITMLPIMMAYPALQKYFVKGIMIGAIKG